MKETQTTSPSLAESNRQLTWEMQDEKIRSFQESIKRAFKVDMTEAAESMKNPRFSWSKFRENVYQHAVDTLQEATSENTFGQLLRAGVNALANNWYRLVPTNHEQIGTTTYSTHAIELHAPLHRGGIPRRVPRGGEFPETTVKGMDLQVVNEKFGAIASFERELFDDDQTGQVQQRAKDIGENMALLKDAWFFQRFIGSAGSFGGDVIPASQTYSSGVWSTSLTGGGANKPASYVAFNPDALQTADLQLMNQLDISGNKMLIQPNTLLVGTSNKFSAATLMNSQWYPVTNPVKVGGTGGTSTTIGQQYATNVMQGMYNVVVSRFLPVKTWAIGEAGRGIIMQERDALELIQENPTAGMAFSQDVFRFRVRERFEPEWLDPRFWYLGNDGSI